MGVSAAESPWERRVTDVTAGKEPRPSSRRQRRRRPDAKSGDVNQPRIEVAILAERAPGGAERVDGTAPGSGRSPSWVGPGREAREQRSRRGTRPERPGAQVLGLTGSSLRALEHPGTRRFRTPSCGEPWRISPPVHPALAAGRPATVPGAIPPAAQRGGGVSGLRARGPVLGSLASVGTSASSVGDGKGDCRASWGAGGPRG